MPADPAKITLHTPDAIYAPRHLPSWFLLCGAAGLVNGWAFVMCEQYVTHVTGTVTRAGLEWPTVGLAAEYAVVFLSFVVGAAFSVVHIQRRARAGRRPRWAVPLGYVAGLLIGVGAAGQAGAFGPFGGVHAADAPPSILLSVLAFAMGLQNAAVASTTGLAVRTTHLTGPSTDLGVHLGVMWLTTGEEQRAAARGAALRAGKVVSFMLGAAVSLPLAGGLGFLALLVPAACVATAAALSFAVDWGPSDFPYPARDEGKDKPAAATA